MIGLKDHRHHLMYNFIRPGSKAGVPVLIEIRVLKYTLDGTIQYKLQFGDESKVKFVLFNDATGTH